METDFHSKKRRHTGTRSNYSEFNRFKKHGEERDDSEWRGTDLREKTKYLIDNRRGSSHSYRNERKNLWDVPINLIGQKENNPMIHMCSTCILPIKSYGRLIPCKHVFCFKCAKKTEKHCPRCKEEVHRIEQCRYGTVWMCNISSCIRTYLSQRDLQAHVNHRHSKPPPPPTIPASIDTSKPPPNMHPQIHSGICHPPPQVPPMARNMPVQPPVSASHSQYMYLPGANNPNQIAADGMGMPPQETLPTELNARPSSNLITIPIQDDPKQEQAYNIIYSQAVPDQSNAAEYLHQIPHNT